MPEPTERLTGSAPTPDRVPGRGRLRASAWAASLLAVVLAAGLGGLFAYGRSDAPSRPASLEPLTLAIAATYPGTGLVFIADAKGYFRAEGLAVTLQPHSSGKSALRSVLEGTADVATVADTPLVFAALGGAPLAIIATIFTTERDAGVVTRRDRVPTPRALAGKRVGMTLGTSGHFFLDSFLIGQRISPDEVVHVNLTPEEMAPALAKGQVDAVATWSPYLETAEAELRHQGVTYYGDGVYTVTFNVAALRRLAETRPEAVKRLLRALLAAAALARADPGASQEIIGRAAGLDRAHVARVWPTYSFIVALQQSLLVILEDQTRWAVKGGLADPGRPVNYLELLYLDGLLAVRPDAVTVIR